MNKVELIGRLTKDPTVRYTEGEKPMAVASYILAVDRRVAKQEQKADFISCIAFGKNGEFVEKYLKKGTKIAVSGRIQTGHYEKDGQTIYTTDVVVEEHEFCESKKTETAEAQVTDGFMSIPDYIDEELPFK